MEPTNVINIDPSKLLRPLISATLLNAFFSALILKKLSGVELTAELKEETLTDLIRLFGVIDQAFVEVLQQAPPQEPLQGQRDPHQ
jgi:hypothetical protein